MKIDPQQTVNGQTVKKVGKWGTVKTTDIFEKLFEKKQATPAEEAEFDKKLILTKKQKLALEKLLQQEGEPRQMMREKFLDKKEEPGTLPGVLLRASDKQVKKEQVAIPVPEKQANPTTQVKEDLLIGKENPFLNKAIPSRQGIEALEKTPKQEIELKITEMPSFPVKKEAKEEPVLGLENQETTKKEEKIQFLVNKIKEDPEISSTLKEKLIEMVQNRKEPEKIFKELKSEIQRVELAGMPVDTAVSPDKIRFESKMEIKEWVDRIKVELRNMMDFRVENENKIRLSLSNDNGFIQLNIEKINNQIIIQSDSSESLKERLDEVLAEVKLEMREKNIDVRLEKEKEKEARKEQESNSKKDEGGKQDGSDNANEQRRRGQ